jgi:hypothetical protein
MGGAYGKKGVQGRISAYVGYSKKSIQQLPKELRRSAFYRFICQTGVDLNFRVLASFDCEIASGYTSLLESIFMITFGSYQYPGRSHIYSSKASTTELRAFGRKSTLVTSEIATMDCIGLCHCSRVLFIPDGLEKTTIQTQSAEKKFLGGT